MAKVEIIGVPPSSYVRTVRIVAEERNIPYELNPARPHTPDVDAIHPLGKIPVMRHGDVTLCESRAIATYLDRAFPGPRLMPDDPVAAAQIEQWVSLICTSLQPAFGAYVGAYYFPGTPDGKADRARIDAAAPKMEQCLAVVERGAAGGHLVGESFTLADMFLIPVLFYLNILPESRAIIAHSPPLSGYIKRHDARPSVQATVPSPVPQHAQAA